MITIPGFHQGKVFTKYQVISWFEENYPKIKKATVAASLIQLSTNMQGRVHYSPKPGEDDLFFQEKSGHFRLYDPATDPPPIYEAAPQETSEETSRFPGDDQQDMGGAPKIALHEYSSEFSLMTIIREGVPMTLEQLGQQADAKQAVKQTGLEAVAALMGWNLWPEYEFEPWRSFEAEAGSDSGSTSEGKKTFVEAGCSVDEWNHT